jgi:hypothetical protein
MPPAIGLAAGGIASAIGAGIGGNKLQKIPPPAPLYPGLNSSFISMLSQFGGGALAGLGNAASGGNNSQFTEAFQTLVKAQQPMIAQGRSNILEQFGSSGLRYSSPLMNTLSTYETNTQNSFLNTLANYQLQSTQQQTQAQEFLASMFGQTASTLYPTVQNTSGGPGAALGSAGNSLGMFALLSQLGMLNGGGS